MIRIENLEKVYASESVELRALAAVSLEVEAGEMVSVMGPSGSGKSTLLHILGLLDVPTAGEYYLAGKPTTRLSERRRTHLRRKLIGFVFQNSNLVEELTVFENVELPLLYGGVPKKERKERVEKVLQEVGVLHRRDHYPSRISGGSQQRAALGRALVARPSLILADEPTGNLASNEGRDVMELLVRFVGQGATVVMVTHSLACARYANRTLNLVDGSLSADATTQSAV